MKILWENCFYSSLIAEWQYIMFIKLVRICSITLKIWLCNAISLGWLLTKVLSGRIFLRNLLCKWNNVFSLNCIQWASASLIYLWRFLTLRSVIQQGLTLSSRDRDWASNSVKLLRLSSLISRHLENTTISSRWMFLNGSFIGCPSLTYFELEPKFWNENFLQLLAWLITLE